MKATRSLASSAPGAVAAAFAPPPLRLAGALATGVLVVLAFPRYGFEAGLDHLIWVALAPLLLAATGAGRRQGLLLGWLAGVVLEGAGFLWILFSIRSFTGFGAVVSSLLFGCWLLYESSLWALLGFALGGSRGSGGAVAALLMFAGLEHYFPRLFPWHLGGALYGRVELLQCADVVGASGLTALVLLGNACLSFLVKFLRGRRRFPLAPVAVFALLLTGAWFYGRHRLEAATLAAGSAPEVGVLLVQGCVDPRVRLAAPLRVMEQYLASTRKWLAAHPAEAAGVNLVVWPEGADTIPFDLTPGADPWSGHGEYKGRLLSVLRTPSAPGDLGRALVVGGSGEDTRRLPEAYNIAVYLQADEPPLFYKKNVPLYFGERVPGIDLVPLELRRKLKLMIGNIAVGDDNPACRLGSDGPRFRHLICYEATLPRYVRRSAEGVDFLVNITEDMWYGNTAHIPQHVSLLVLRAVENRVPLVRAANVGPSGVIDVYGRFKRGEKVFGPELVLGSFRAMRLPTSYRVWGYLLPLGMAIAGSVVWLLTSLKVFRGALCAFLGHPA